MFTHNLRRKEEQFQQECKDSPEGQKKYRQMPDKTAPASMPQKSGEQVGKKKAGDPADHEPRDQYSSNRYFRRYYHYKLAPILLAGDIYPFNRIKDSIFHVVFLWDS